jgi:hypothetical protein
MSNQPPNGKNHHHSPVYLKIREFRLYKAGPLFPAMLVLSRVKLMLGPALHKPEYFANNKCLTPEAQCKTVRDTFHKLDFRYV